MRLLRAVALPSFPAATLSTVTTHVSRRLPLVSLKLTWTTNDLAEFAVLCTVTGTVIRPSPAEAGAPRLTSSLALIPLFTSSSRRLASAEAEASAEAP